MHFTKCVCAYMDVRMYLHTKLSLESRRFIPIFELPKAHSHFGLSMVHSHLWMAKRNIPTFGGLKIYSML